MTSRDVTLSATAGVTVTSINRQRTTTQNPSNHRFRTPLSKEMILDYKFVKGYQLDHDRACRAAHIEFTPTNETKVMIGATDVIDRDEYVITAVGRRIDDPLKEDQFIFVLDFGNNSDELDKRELDLTGKKTLLQAAEHILSGPFVYAYVN